MATFKVGQRVRVNCPGSGRHGEETTIRRLDISGYSWGRNYIGAEVTLPCRTSDKPFCIFEYHHLEPIVDRKIDSGRTVVSWEVGVSAWVPEHLRQKREQPSVLEPGLTK